MSNDEMLKQVNVLAGNLYWEGFLIKCIEVELLPDFAIDEVGNRKTPAILPTHYDSDFGRIRIKEVNNKTKGGGLL